jgi:hypothetical protein
MSYFFIPISTVLAIALNIGSAAYAFDNASISGTVTCSASALLNSQPFAAGQITVVTDGRGNFTSGRASYQLAGQPRPRPATTR